MRAASDTSARLAMLIDADNTQPTIAHRLLAEITNDGTAHVNARTETGPALACVAGKISWPHGTTQASARRNNAATPSLNGDDSLNANTTCTRGSSRNTSTASRTRSVDVTVRATASTVRCAATVTQLPASPPTGARTAPGSTRVRGNWLRPVARVAHYGTWSDRFRTQRETSR